MLQDMPVNSLDAPVGWLAAGERTGRYRGVCEVQYVRRHFHPGIAVQVAALVGAHSTQTPMVLLVMLVNALAANIGSLAAGELAG